MLAGLSAGHDRTGTTVWLALTLWTMMALGEAGLMLQSSMWLAVWCALFSLPSLYLQCRHILDLLVDEALHLVAAFLKAGLPSSLPPPLPFPPPLFDIALSSIPPCLSGKQAGSPDKLQVVPLLAS